MTSPQQNPDTELNHRLKEALDWERQQRDPSQQDQFTAGVMARIAQEKGQQRKQIPRWLTLAASVFIVIAAAWVMLSPRFNRPNPRTLRLAALKTSLPLSKTPTALPGFLPSEDGTNYVLLPYDYYGERCLWLYPESSLKFESSQEETEFAAREKWYALARNGVITIPHAALQATVPDREDWLILRIGNHYEIWTREGLNRYLQKGS